VYNKWHETELERWLSDQNIPYPTPADRKDLEDLVSKNWNDYVVEPYNKWDTSQLSAYLQARGSDVASEAKKNKDSLLSQVKSNWYETEDSANAGWASVKDWILDTWTDSQLKAFCDKHGIPGMRSLPYYDIYVGSTTAGANLGSMCSSSAAYS
jgi:hypothetical protein